MEIPKYLNCKQCQKAMIVTADQVQVIKEIGGLPHLAFCVKECADEYIKTKK